MDSSELYHWKFIRKEQVGRTRWSSGQPSNKISEEDISMTSTSGVGKFHSGLTLSANGGRHHIFMMYGDLGLGYASISHTSGVETNLIASRIVQWSGGDMAKFGNNCLSAGTSDQSKSFHAIVGEIKNFWAVRRLARRNRGLTSCRNAKFFNFG